MKLSNSLHRGVIKLSAGRKGWDAFGMPVIKLTTTGRKTGLPRSVMLTSPHQIGESLVLVASKGGSDTHPEWFLNLVADPNVVVETRIGRKEMTAQVVAGDAREQLWDEVTEKFRNYGQYQSKTDRLIPLIILS